MDEYITGLTTTKLKEVIKQAIRELIVEESKQDRIQKLFLATMKEKFKE